ncbi:GIY-YIG nuclease family protein [Candidatus Microgenomates bacterium]|nr:GIY-YIG nuclease family protein [Candidatus Microgenomates bacterium]
MSGWVYILKLANGKYYYGSTSNLPQRLKIHLCGKSPFTSKHLPLELVFCSSLVVPTYVGRH